MPIEVRNRSRGAHGPDGSWTTRYTNGNPDVTDYRAKLLFNEVCTDVIGDYGGNHAFIVDKQLNDIVPVSGELFSWQNPKLHTLVGYPDDSCNAFAGHLSIALPTLTGSQLASRMSPNRPLVDLPVFLFELRDFPGLIKDGASFFNNMKNIIPLLKDAGDTILKRGGFALSVHALPKVAKANLSYQFGWDPLISDLLALTGFTEAFERRKKQLRNLHSEKGLRRRIKVDTNNTSSVLSGPFHTRVWNLSGSQAVTTTVERWATSRWKSYGQEPPASASEADSEAIRSLLGLSFSAASLWQAMPWSWLADYFTDIGSYLEANRNTVPATCGETVSLMKRSTTVATRRISSITLGLSGGGGVKRRTTKERTPLTLATLPGEFPFLGANQVGILASLSVARRNAWK